VNPNGGFAAIDRAVIFGVDLTRDATIVYMLTLTINMSLSTDAYGSSAFLVTKRFSAPGLDAGFAVMMLDAAV